MENDGLCQGDKLPHRSGERAPTKPPKRSEWRLEAIEGTARIVHYMGHPLRHGAGVGDLRGTLT